MSDGREAEKPRSRKSMTCLRDHFAIRRVHFTSRSRGSRNKIFFQEKQTLKTSIKMVKHNAGAEPVQNSAAPTLAAAADDIVKKPLQVPHLMMAMEMVMVMVVLFYIGTTCRIVLWYSRVIVCGDGGGNGAEYGDG